MKLKFIFHQLCWAHSDSVPEELKITSWLFADDAGKINFEELNCFRYPPLVPKKWLLYKYKKL